MSEIIQHDQEYTVKFLLDNGVELVKERPSDCPHLRVAQAVILAAVTELRKHVQEDAVVPGFANTFLRKGFVEMGTKIHDFNHYIAGNKCEVY